MTNIKGLVKYQMEIKAVILSLGLVITWSNGKSENLPDPTTQTYDNVCPMGRQAQSEIRKAKEWIVKTIEVFFREYDSNKGDYSSICTKEYAAYKSDATNVEMGDGLSMEEFNIKWKSRIGPHTSLNTGFMISGQDFGTIKVSKCEILKSDRVGRLHFKVIIDDLDFKVEYFRTIILIKKDHTFEIDDVLELKEVFKK